MAVAARYFEFDKAQCDKLLITEDPSVMFSIVKVACDQTQPGSLILPPPGASEEKRVSQNLGDDS